MPGKSARGVMSDCHRAFQAKPDFANGNSLSITPLLSSSSALERFRESADDEEQMNAVEAKRKPKRHLVRVTVDLVKPRRVVKQEDGERRYPSQHIKLKKPIRLAHTDGTMASAP